MTNNIDVLLRGRQFKFVVENIYASVRKEYGLKQIEVEILLYLKELPNDSASNISRNLFLNKGYVSQAFDSLVKNGFLIPSINEHDRRFVSYTFTDKCRKFMDIAEDLRVKAYNDFFKGVSEEEMTALNKLCDKLMGNLSQMI